MTPPHVAGVSLAPVSDPEVARQLQMQQEAWASRQPKKQPHLRVDLPNGQVCMRAWMYLAVDLHSLAR